MSFIGWSLLPSQPCIGVWRRVSAFPSSSSLFPFSHSSTHSFLTTTLGPENLKINKTLSLPIVNVSQGRTSCCLQSHTDNTWKHKDLCSLFSIWWLWGLRFLKWEGSNRWTLSLVALRFGASRLIYLSLNFLNSKMGIILSISSHYYGVRRDVWKCNIFCLAHGVSPSKGSFCHYHICSFILQFMGMKTE